MRMTVFTIAAALLAATADAQQFVPAGKDTLRGLPTVREEIGMSVDAFVRDWQATR